MRTNALTPFAFVLLACSASTAGIERTGQDASTPNDEPANDGGSPSVDGALDDTPDAGELGADTWAPPPLPDADAPDTWAPPPDTGTPPPPGTKHNGYLARHGWCGEMAACGKIPNTPQAGAACLGAEVDAKACTNAERATCEAALIAATCGEIDPPPAACAACL
jgi:hypothetical protein